MSDFMERLSAKRAANGEANWLVCPCQEGIDPPAGWLPAVYRDARGEFIAALLCCECENEICINGGRLEL